MNNKDTLKRKIEGLKKQAEEIEELGVKLLEEVPCREVPSLGVLFHSLDYRSPLRKLQRELIIKYQQWYSTCLQ